MQLVIISVITIFFTFISFILPKKISVWLLFISSCSMIVYLFMTNEFFDTALSLSVMFVTYFSFTVVFDHDKKVKKQQLQQKLSVTNFQIVELKRDVRRILMDIWLAGGIAGVSVICLLFLPEMIITLKYVLGYYLILMLPPFLNRLLDYLFAKVYMLPEEQVLVIISLLEARELPMEHLESIQKQSNPDMLRLHPSFAFLSERKDYTTSFATVLRLTFSGETMYLTPVNVEAWSMYWDRFIQVAQVETEKNILPIWHRSNIKRLLWKGYFAISVKGVAAYTALLSILIFLHCPWYVITVFVFLWWLFNMYIADRLLIHASDAEEVTAGELYHISQEIFSQAGITGTRLYMIDSDVYNGFATGMHIGKGTIMLTSATTKLSSSAVKAILAHEAIHIKKRDVMVNQIGRMVLMIVLGFSIFVSFDLLKQLIEQPLLFIILINLFSAIFLSVYQGFLNGQK
ncbi:M56 family metallopeptidase [Virgibacillus chiguensis]|uniref:Peptidase family M48 n=1 Tax=Virgibacillus chiguensis TaxID=411959 RepID=A0A1M5S0Z8_9BACI|nr:M56 family metallopeptidase [Virgibacillus chiguensis]SHH32277.1 Peptidase family M48 [Virgibacillus chiguensis]